MMISVNQIEGRNPLRIHATYIDTDQIESMHQNGNAKQGGFIRLVSGAVIETEDPFHDCLLPKWEQSFDDYSPQQDLDDANARIIDMQDNVEGMTEVCEHLRATAVTLQGRIEEGRKREERAMKHVCDARVALLDERAQVSRRSDVEVKLRAECTEAESMNATQLLVIEDQQRDINKLRNSLNVSQEAGSIAAKERNAYQIEAAALHRDIKVMKTGHDCAVEQRNRAFGSRDTAYAKVDDLKKSAADHYARSLELVKMMIRLRDRTKRYQCQCLDTNSIKADIREMHNSAGIEA